MKAPINPLKNWLSVLALTFLLGSCQFVMRTAFGIRMPKSEPFEEQRAYLRKLNINSEHLFNLKREYTDSNEYKAFNVVKPYMGDKAPFSLVQFRFFSLKDDYSTGWAICLGNLEKTRLLDSFPIR